MAQKPTNKDVIYKERFKKVSDFIFDETVAEVFDDMIKRSVPGYAAIINMIGVLANQYAQPGSRCYDLGSSLGAASFAIVKNVDVSQVEIIAVDNSLAMVQRCQKNVPSVKTICANIEDVKIENASVVVLNFTLQFFNPSKRSKIIQNIYNGMRDGGILILSEKIAFEEKEENARQIELHHAFKRMHGYSGLEIAQKRTALENVLIPDTLVVHRKRLKDAGFQSADVWFQCFNFMSLVAIK